MATRASKVEWDEIAHLVNPLNTPAIRKQTSKKQFEILYEYKRKLPSPITPPNTIVETKCTNTVPAVAVVQEPLPVAVVPAQREQLPVEIIQEPLSVRVVQAQQLIKKVPRSCMKKQKLIVEDLNSIASSSPSQRLIVSPSSEIKQCCKFEIQYCPCELERDQYKQVRFSKSYSYSFSTGSSSTKQPPLLTQEDEAITIDQLPMSIGCKTHLYKCNGMPADTQSYQLQLPFTKKLEQQHSHNAIQISTQLSSDSFNLPHDFGTANKHETAMGTFVGIIPIIQDTTRDSTVNSTSAIKKISTVGLRQCKFEIEWVYETIATGMMTLTPVISYRLPFWGTCLNPPNHIEIPRLILHVQVDFISENFS